MVYSSYKDMIAPKNKLFSMDYNDISGFSWHRKGPSKETALLQRWECSEYRGDEEREGRFFLASPLQMLRILHTFIASLLSFPPKKQLLISAAAIRDKGWRKPLLCVICMGDV